MHSILRVIFLLIKAFYAVARFKSQLQINQLHLVRRRRLMRDGKPIPKQSAKIESYTKQSAHTFVVREFIFCIFLLILKSGILAVVMTYFIIKLCICG